MFTMFKMTFIAFSVFAISFFISWLKLATVSKGTVAEGRGWSHSIRFEYIRFHIKFLKFMLRGALQHTVFTVEFYLQCVVSWITTEFSVMTTCNTALWWGVARGLILTVFCFFEVVYSVKLVSDHWSDFISFSSHNCVFVLEDLDYRKHWKNIKMTIGWKNQIFCQKRPI